jgi:PrsW family intramembrane metalloprotease
MHWALPALAALFASGGLVFAFWLWRRVAQAASLKLSRAVIVVLGGMAAATLAIAIEIWVLRAAGVALQTDERGGPSAALAMVLFCAPLEEALKVAVVWPLYLRRRLGSGSIGAIYAMLAAAGFAAVEAIVSVALGGEGWWALMRSGLAIPAHLFFAGIWGYTLGGGGRDRYFGMSWLGCVLVHGLYDHIVFGRGIAVAFVVFPMLALMAFASYALLREPGVAASGRSSSYSLFDPPSVGSVRDAMARKGRPLMIHWILIGAFVNLGVTLIFLAASVYCGHRFGVDFSLVDEAGVDGITPIVLLGSGLLASFPVSAFLIARASSAVSVLEPAWATGASIIAVLALFSVTEPTALVIAVGIAPVGFILACVGAWFGLEHPE